MVLAIIFLSTDWNSVGDVVNIMAVLILGWVNLEAEFNIFSFCPAAKWIYDNQIGSETH